MPFKKSWTSVMRKTSKFLSLILSVCLGVNIIADANPNNADQTSQYIEPLYEKLVNYSTADCPDIDLPSDGNCADPCHIGSCHFGHCSHHIISGYSLISPCVFNKDHLVFNALVPEYPYLDGLRRPPRYS